ncbi:hypothetical protein Mkiyose1665_10790 [Mycobacterium kiyosense]|uniref:Uncharacterized protein n=1 Tax=Mycobacterium kiyosense TaxID=2871094 RepID=A0AA37Q803_9MYCO|nr:MULTISPECIES: hypothetical protein [Mycobacterium]GLB85419.1 hypothetical protein SRL2020028_46750 [Mycobacterium kiyosense]GLB96231.1 hypothetical protein SRL2020226_30070 [Mycobacterium kiyosense]GLD40579.1 hypothetical protein Mkiyose1665_10790 [Mycobacterium kiyosense]
MQDLHIDTGTARVMAWSGVALVISLVIAQGVLMGFIPPPSPALKADEIAHLFIDRKLRIRIGTLIECIGFTFYLTWSMSIVFFMRRMERGMPVLSYTAIANAGGGYVFFLLMPITWAALAFRPEMLDPALLQIANDYVWFVFILSWPPFAVFMILIAVAVLRDKNPTPIFPRWVGFLNLWTAVLIIPAGLVEFFKIGPFAYDGAISFWFVWIVFFGWIIGMSVITLRACTAEKRRQLAEQQSGDEVLIAHDRLAS